MDRARAIATAVKRHAGGLKLGLEFFCHNGRHGVLELAELGLPIFLDLKLHDIPNTVAKAIQALAPITPAVLTVHAAGGRAMLEDAKAAAPTGTKVVAVTVLTSLDGDDLASIGVNVGQPRPGRTAGRSGQGSRPRRHRLFRQRSCGRAQEMEGRLLRRSRNPPGQLPSSATRSG